MSLWRLSACVLHHSCIQATSKPFELASAGDEFGIVWQAAPAERAERAVPAAVL